MNDSVEPDTDKSPQSSATGPIFIIGLARSGTKLLRDILNNSEQLFFLPSETNFFPHFISRFGTIDNSLSDSQKSTFKRSFYTSIFYRGMKIQGFDMPESVLDTVLNNGCWEDIFSALAVAFRDQTNSKATILGDKTPKHIDHIKLLKKEFPNAKFIHIIRDPRDRAASAKTAWNANLFLSAEQWRRKMDRSRAIGKSLGDDYAEIRYEDLIADPEKEVSRLCAFLGVPFNSNLLVLRKPTENLGREDAETRTSLQIVSTNKNKFLKSLSEKQLLRIEEIVLPAAKELGYPFFSKANNFRPLSKASLFFYRLMDDFRGTTYHFLRWGFKDGFLFTKERALLKLGKYKPF
jgi:hypothetical protein